MLRHCEDKNFPERYFYNLQYRILSISFARDDIKPCTQIMKEKKICSLYLPQIFPILPSCLAHLIHLTDWLASLEMHLSSQFNLWVLEDRLQWTIWCQPVNSHSKLLKPESCGNSCFPFSFIHCSRSLKTTLPFPLVYSNSSLFSKWTYIPSLEAAPLTICLQDRRLSIVLVSLEVKKNLWYFKDNISGLDLNGNNH